MPSTVFGLPVHVLVVHAAVVLLPLAALGVVVVAVWPAARRRYGLGVLLLTFVATLTVPLATSSGEGLQELVPSSALVSQHVRLGQSMLVLAALLGLATAAVVLLDVWRRTMSPAASTESSSDVERWLADRAPSSLRTSRVPGWYRSVALGASALALVLGVATVAQIARVGHTGARAAWDGRLTSQPAG